MLDVAELGLRAREVLRERAGDLVRETCAWSVGLSDTTHYVRRDGRVVPSGSTLGDRAEAGQPLSTEGAGRFALGDARAGSFQDALNALTREGGVHADRLDAQVLDRFALDTAVLAAASLRDTEPDTWVELLDELGEDGEDLPAVVRALEWDVTLRADAEQLVLAALGAVPLVEVESEGVPLAVVHAAERLTADAVPAEQEGPEPDEAVLFLAEAAVRRLPAPVPPSHAQQLLQALREEGLEPDEIRDALPHLPVLADTAERVGLLMEEESGPQ